MNLNKTERFLESALVKGVIDNFDIVENGYTVGKGDKTLNIRVAVDSALIRDSEKLIEVKSGRLDDVLHRYIMCSLFGNKASNYFVANAYNGQTIFVDINNNKWILNHTSPEAAKMYFTQFVNNQAVDALIASRNLVPYSKNEVIESSAYDVTTEVELLVSDLNPDSYAVLPSHSVINSVGKTVVGGFVASAADRDVVKAFNAKESEVFGKSIKSSVENNQIDVAKALRNARTNADYVTVQLDSSRKLRMTVQRDGIFNARFTLTPDVKRIQNSMNTAGYVFSDIQSGITLDAKNPIISAIINTASDVQAVEEKSTIACEIVSCKGEDVTKALRAYAIDDSLKLFSNMTTIKIA